MYDDIDDTWQRKGIADILIEQAPTLGKDEFICKKCRNYMGHLVCKENIFIGFEGANMSNCKAFKSGRYPNVS